MINKEDLIKSEISCIHFGKYSDEFLRIQDYLRSLNYFVAKVESEFINSEKDLLNSVSDVFNFPDYFGNNWDALQECLRDMDWLPASGYILVINNANALWKKSPVTIGKLIESWLFCAQDWIKEGKPFHLIFIFEDE